MNFTINMYYIYSYVNGKYPYYIGKGKGPRAYTQWHHSVPVPDIPNIHILTHFDDNIKALIREWELINFLGLKKEGGILENKMKANLLNGPKIHTEETKEKMRNAVDKEQRSRRMMGNKINLGKDNASKIWEIKYPNGRVELVKNLAKFCRENNISKTAASNNAKGLSKTVGPGLVINKINQ